MTDTNSPIFLTGATGNIGSQTLQLLQKSQKPVRIICRRQQQLDDFSKRGLNAVLGNLDDPVESLAEHMRGCDSLLLLTAATPKQLEQDRTAIDAAVVAGVKWMVRISAGDARDGTNVPWVTAHAAADRYLKAKASEHGFTWTLLKTSAFMQNLLGAAPPIQKGFLPQAAGNGKAGWIDTADIAATIHQIFLDGAEKHRDREYILTGPQLISMSDIAGALSNQIGHRVRYLNLPGPVFKALLRFGGADLWTANGVVAQFTEIVRPNKEGIDVSRDVETITGKPPNSIEDFAARHKDAFKGRDILPYLQVGGGVLVALVAWQLSK